jgi:hypothetical protein
VVIQKAVVLKEAEFFHILKKYVEAALPDETVCNLVYAINDCGNLATVTVQLGEKEVK